MKRNLLFSAMALGMGLLSCTKDDLGNRDALAPVTISVDVPAAIQSSVSRALPAAPEGHKLRCIMLVDYAGAEDLRIEKTATGQEVNGVFRFSFTPAEEDYNCYFWADYVGEDGADKYYDTRNLDNITYKVADNTVFNNPACDAFYGKALPGSANATLKRPFTKLAIVDKSQETVNNAASLGVAYSVPAGFNVKDNTTASSATLTMTAGTPYDKANSVWFYNYVFAATDDNSLGDISMTVGGDTHTLNGANIPLQANYEVTGTIDFASADGNINIDVDIDDEYVDPDAPKFGQFLQKDGTFSDTYDASNSMAIVFAVGPKGGDTAENYGKAEGTKIWGYAMGLSSVARKTFTTAETEFDLQDISVESPWAADDYNGYAYTVKLMEKVTSAGLVSSALMTAYEEWKTTNALTGIDNVSGWYIPSSRQLLDVMGMTLGYAGEDESGIPAVSKDDEFAGKVSSLMGGTTSWFGSHTGLSNIMSSSVNDGGQIMAVQTSYSSNVETIVEALGTNVDKRASTYAIRPVLTIFAK